MASWEVQCTHRVGVLSNEFDFVICTYDSLLFVISHAVNLVQPVVHSTISVKFPLPEVGGVYTQLSFETQTSVQFCIFFSSISLYSVRMYICTYLYQVGARQVVYRVLGKYWCSMPFSAAQVGFPACPSCLSHPSYIRTVRISDLGAY